MSGQNILSAFNDHFIEFVSDIQTVFPDNHDILVAKNSLIAIRKANPKMIIKIWTTFVVGQYQKEIERGDIDFFIDKDYSNDLVSTESSSKIMEGIDRLRKPIKEMSHDNRAKATKYIQNLTKLASMYESMS